MKTQRDRGQEDRSTRGVGSAPVMSSSLPSASPMEIIFGRNKKEQLEPVSARVTGETSMLKVGISFSVLQVAFGSLKTHAREQDKARSPNRFPGNLGVFADANLVSRERAEPSCCPLKSAWRDSHSESGETADSSHEWGLSTMWVPEIEPRCQAWMPVTLPAVPFCWPSGGVF